MQKEHGKIQGDLPTISELEKKEIKKPNHNLIWHVELGLNTTELKNPQLIVISQNLSYCIQNGKPSLKFMQPITLEELDAIVAKFPVETPLVICYGDGQNRYRREVIYSLNMNSIKETDEVKDENLDPWEQSKADGVKWLAENAKLVEKWKLEKRTIRLCTAAEFMETNSCENTYQKICSQYYSSTTSSNKLIELKTLFKNFAGVAMQTLYKDLIRNCISGQKFYFGDSPKELKVEELESKLFDASLKYLLHETAVLVELCKLDNFQYLLYKQKIKKDHNGSNSESLNFQQFSRKLIHLLPKCYLGLMDSTKRKIQYREFVSSQNSEVLLEKTNKKLHKQNTIKKPRSQTSSAISNEYFPSHPTGTEMISEGFDIVQITYQRYKKPLVAAPVRRSPSNDSNKSYCSTETSGSLASQDSSPLSSTCDSFDEKFFFEPVREVKITPSKSPTPSTPEDNIKREKIARLCCELFCHMIKSDKFNRIECLVAIADSPFNEDTRTILTDAANQKDSKDNKEIKVLLDVTPETKHEFLAGSEYRKDIQFYCVDLFIRIYQKRVLALGDALTKISKSPLDEKYRQEILNYIHHAFDRRIKPLFNTPAMTRSLPIPSALKRNNNYTSLAKSWPPSNKSGLLPGYSPLNVNPPTPSRKKPNFFSTPSSINRTVDTGRRASLGYTET